MLLLTFEHKQGLERVVTFSQLIRVIFLISQHCVTQFILLRRSYPLSKILGCYSETRFHIGMDRNFVFLHGADTIAIDLSLSALISLCMKSNIVFLNISNLHAIISTLLIIYLQ
jgi:hypothetical protein